MLGLLAFFGLKGRIDMLDFDGKHSGRIVAVGRKEKSQQLRT